MRKFLLTAVVFALGFLGIQAQQMQQIASSAPILNMAYPAGGKAGSTFEVTVTGQNFDAVEGLHFSFPGATAEVLNAEMAPVDKNPQKRPKGMQAGPRAAYKFKVTVPEKTPLGIHDVRVVTKAGVSNPRAFVVGDLPETAEKEPNDDVPTAQRIPLDSVVHGVIGTPTDVDYYQFAGKKGQRVVVSCLTSSIDSRLPAAIQLYSMAGKFLGFNRNYQNNDALIDATLPEDGDYFVRVFGFTHTIGGPDYFYRLSVSTAPWIDAVVPSAVEAGKETKVTVFGRNLPGGVIDPALKLDGVALEKVVVTVKPPVNPKAKLDYSGMVLPMSSSLDGFELRLRNAAGASNPFLIAYARAPVIVEAAPSNVTEAANVVPLPVQVAGRIEKRGEIDWYRFAGKKGQPLAIELFGDRLGSPADFKFTLKAARTTLTTQDDNLETMSPQFYSRTDDPPRYRFTPGEDADYFVGVSSADNGFGPRHVYSLRIAPEDGDFQVVAMPVSNVSPDCAVTGPEGNYAYTLFVWRLGNFTSDITVSATKLPPGVTMKPQIVSATQKQAAAVLSVATGAPAYSGPIVLEAQAEING